MRWKTWPRYLILLLALTSFGPHCGFGAETTVTVESENFLVTAPTAALAKEVLLGAEAYRSEIAILWLGEKLPVSVGRTMVRMKPSETEDKAISLIADNKERLTHCIWLTASERQLRTALAHEMVHVVLATRHPGTLPAWIHEGIAGAYDAPDRQATRQEILAWFGRTKNWPPLARLLQADCIPRQDQAQYAAAVSLTEFLLSRADRRRLIDFAIAANGHRWDEALQSHYGIANVAQLETLWQTWASWEASRDTQADGSMVSGRRQWQKVLQLNAEMVQMRN